ncbi:MAG: lytic murein transglycosylase B [Gammaproteobacteria bacterium]|nr:lytic murein transglycosylase B [Gammaproteobacteria bacterium]MDH3767627.1 lytic murein transglycosylase B [Gammaproteobacteria bacterium]
MRTATLCLTFVLFPAAAFSFEASQIDSFVEEVVERHGLDRQWVQEILDAAERKQSILNAISRPAEKTRPWHEYRALFINDRRINDGVVFWQEHSESLAQVSSECGIPAEIIVAILGIETHYGSRAGNFRIIDALSTLAFEYPPRSDFFRGELEQFLLLTREHSIDPLQALGSYAGAMGAAQFISSSYRRYAVDGSGDGKIDLWHDWRDVIGSVAYYLHSFGWRPNEPVRESISVDAETAAEFIGEKLELRHNASDLRNSNIQLDEKTTNEMPVLVFALENNDGTEYWVGYKNFYVITRYNRSTMYAMAVLDLGRAISEKVQQK